MWRRLLAVAGAQSRVAPRGGTSSAFMASTSTAHLRHPCAFAAPHGSSGSPPLAIRARANGTCAGRNNKAGRQSAGGQARGASGAGSAGRSGPGATQLPRRKLPWAAVVGAGAFVSVGALVLAAPSLEQWTEAQELTVLRATGALAGDFITVPVVSGSGSVDGEGGREVYRVVARRRQRQAGGQDAEGAEEEKASNRDAGSVDVDVEVVVVINGSVGEASFDFAGLQRRVSEFATCVVYDRAGHGFSELPKSFGFNAFAHELQAVLDTDATTAAATVAGDTADTVGEPDDSAQRQSRGRGGCARAVRLVLVGQGYGALLNHEFVKRYPECVAGVLALDPAVLGAKALQRALDPAVARATEAVRDQTLHLVKLARFGITRQMLRTRVNDDQLRANYGEPDAAGGGLFVLARTAQSRMNHREAIAGELKFWDEVEARLAAGDPDVEAAMALGEDTPAVARIPCTVMLPQDTDTFKQLADRELVAPEVAREMHRVWFEQQKRYARKFARGRVVVVPNAGAQMHRDAPDAVTGEIRRMVQAARAVQ